MTNMAAAEAGLPTEVRVIVRRTGASEDTPGWIAAVPASAAFPGRVVGGMMVVERMCWPHEYRLPLGAERPV